MNPLVLNLFNVITRFLIRNGAEKKQGIELTKEGFEELKKFAKSHDDMQTKTKYPSYMLPLLEKPNQRWEKPEFYFNGFNFIIEVK